MTNTQETAEIRRRGRKKTLPLTPKLAPDDRLRVFVNLVIDRILEDQAKGNISLIKEVKNG